MTAPEAIAVLVAVGYWAYLILTSERRKKTPREREPGSDDE